MFIVKQRTFAIASFENRQRDSGVGSNIWKATPRTPSDERTKKSPEVLQDSGLFLRHSIKLEDGPIISHNIR